MEETNKKSIKECSKLNKTKSANKFSCVVISFVKKLLQLICQPSLIEVVSEPIKALPISQAQIGFFTLTNNDFTSYQSNDSSYEEQQNLTKRESFEYFIIHCHCLLS